MRRPNLLRFFFSHSELYLHPHVARPDTKASIVLFYSDPHQTPIKIIFRPVYCVRTSSVEMRIQYFFPPLVAAAIHMLLLRKKDHSRKYNCMTSSLSRSPYYSHCGSYSTNFPAAFVGAGGTFLLAMSELLAACNRQEFPLGERLPDGCSSMISGLIVGVEYQSENLN